MSPSDTKKLPQILTTLNFKFDIFFKTGFTSFLQSISLNLLRHFCICIHPSLFKQPDYMLLIHMRERGVVNQPIPIPGRGVLINPRTDGGADIRPPGGFS